MKEVKEAVGRESDSIRVGGEGERERERERGRRNERESRILPSFLRYMYVERAYFRSQKLHESF